MSHNLDYLDVLPSLHLSLVLGGRPIEIVADANKEFRIRIEEMTELIGPYLYRPLLKEVQDTVVLDYVEISDVFI